MKRNILNYIFLQVLTLTILASATTSCQDSDFVLSDDSSTPYEADIRYVVINDPSILKVESDTLYKVYNESPEISLNIDADLTKLAPQFILTNGAQIYIQDEDGEWTVEANGVERDFSQSAQQYLVVSENGQSHHLYSLSFNCEELSTEYHFEWFELNDSTTNSDGSWKTGVSHYYIWKEYDDNGVYRFTWATANGGYAISRVNTAPDSYPTSPCEGVNGGYGIKLTTLSTGGVAALMNMRLAAGNLFLGEFDVTTALRDARASTHFGVPFNKKPLQLRGWMSYTPGNDFQDENGNIVDETDSCDVYAILYKNTDDNGNSIHLDGNTVSSSEYIVGRTKLDSSLMAGTDGQWVYFIADFDYDSYSEELVSELIDNYGYNIAVVASSSNRGAYFQGAIGSTLKIDELEIVYEK